MIRSLLALAAMLIPAPLFAAPPNVVLIVADDLGWRDLGCYGSTYHKTPNIDRLAKDGARFTEFYAACPVCSPTRASLLTGRYPQRMNITDWLPGRPDNPNQMLKRPALEQELPQSEQTLAESFKSAGYVAGIIGKWHLGADPRKHGFDSNIAGDATGTARSYFSPFENKLGAMPGLQNAPENEYLTDRLGREAEWFIDANKAKPFFLYLPHYAPHTPLTAKKDVIAKYPGSPAHGKQSHPVYAAMIESLDDAVGRVLKKLDDLKLAENTIVIFTSDNGGLATLEGMPFAPTINAPLREGKGYLYEGGIRVPFILKYPGKVKPATIGAVGCSIDVYPTLFDVAEVPLDNKESPPPLDGVSLKAALNGGKVERKDDAIYWHYPHYANQGSKPGGAIRAGNFKLIEYYETGRRELFDIKNDISESRNLIVEKKAVADNLAARLDTWRKSVGAKMPTPNPDYKPNPPDKNGIITLPASSATVTGVMLRFEPLPHKNTLGFWVNKDDRAAFEFTVATAGTYTVEVLQGCGKGSGGAEVSLETAGQKLAFTVKDTGGFQAFEAREVGEFTFDKPGRYKLDVIPKTKPGVAVMDLRQVVLWPKKAGANDKPVWNDARRFLAKAAEWELLALDPSIDKPDPKDAFRGWNITGRTVVKDADARKALLAALDKGIADAAENRRKDEETGLLKASGCFEPRHGIRAKAHGQTVEVLICFECSPVQFFLGEGKGQDETVKAPQDAFDQVLKDAGISVAPRLFNPKK